MICCLMLNTLTGRKPTKWMVTLMSLYLQGLAGDDDVLRELNKPDNTGIKLRAEAENLLRTVSPHDDSVADRR